MSDTESMESNYMIDHEYDVPFCGEILDIDALLPIEPTPTSVRLAKYPEMYHFRPLRRPSKIPNFPAPPPVAEPVKMTKIQAIERKSSEVKESMCTDCGWWFRSPAILASHKELHELGQLESLRPPSFVCPYEDCDARCDCQSTLNEHVREVHQRIDLIQDNFHFPNWIEFERWKESLEFNTTSRFVQSTCRNTTTGRTTLYSCFFTPKSVKNRPRGGIRQRQSRKLDKSCTAYMQVREVYGQILVRGCLTHCGHEGLIHQLPLSPAIKKEIAGALARGITEETILNNFRDSCSPDDRRYYIRPYEIRNILNKLKKNQGIHMGIHMEHLDNNNRRELMEEENEEEEEIERIEEINDKEVISVRDESEETQQQEIDVVKLEIED